MVSLLPSPQFDKAFEKLGGEQKLRAAKSLKQFLADPRHPSLHFEKLSSGYRTIRVDLNFRIVLKAVGGVEDSFVLVTVDTHTKVYQRY